MKDKEKKNKISKAQEAKTCEPSKEILSKEKPSNEKMSKQPAKEKNTKEQAAGSVDDKKQKSQEPKKDQDAKEKLPDVKPFPKPTSDYEYTYWGKHRDPDLMMYCKWAADAIYPRSIGRTSDVQNNRVDDYLSPRSTLTTHHGNTYMVLERLGKTSYKVKKMNSQKTYFMKIQSTGMPEFGPNLKRWWEILEIANDRGLHHFPELIEKSELSKLGLLVVVTELAGPNLVEFRESIEAEYDTHTAFRLAYETLKCLNDLHGMGYMLRDVQPRHFSIGTGSERRSNNVLLTNFNYALPYPPEKGESHFWYMMKFPWFNHKFMPRAFHIHQFYTVRDDIESWIYMTYDFFDSRTGLPWAHRDHNERAYYMYKKLFFVGYFDKLRNPFVPEGLRFLRELRAQDLHPYYIDYATYANVLETEVHYLGLELKQERRFGFKKRPKVGRTPYITPEWAQYSASIEELKKRMKEKSAEKKSKEEPVENVEKKNKDEPAETVKMNDKSVPTNLMSETRPATTPPVLPEDSKPKPGVKEMKEPWTAKLLVDDKKAKAKRTKKSEDESDSSSERSRNTESTDENKK